MAFRMTFLRDAIFAASLCIGAAGVVGDAELAGRVAIVAGAVLGNLALLARSADRFVAAVVLGDHAAPSILGFAIRMIVGAPVVAYVAMSQGRLAALIGLSTLMVAAVIHAAVQAMHSSTALNAQESPC